MPITTWKGHLKVTGEHLRCDYQRTNFKPIQLSHDKKKFIPVGDKVQWLGICTEKLRGSGLHPSEVLPPFLSPFMFIFYL